MAHNLREQDIDEAYAPAFQFLRSIPQTIAEVERNRNPDFLRLKAEQIEFEIEALKTPFPSLMQARSLTSSTLLTLDRLSQLRLILNVDDDSTALRRVRRSSVATVEVVIMLGEDLVRWLCRLIASFSSDDSDADEDTVARFKAFLATIPGYRLPKEGPPVSNDQILNCSKFLEEEKTSLIACLRNVLASGPPVSTRSDGIAIAKEMSANAKYSGNQNSDPATTNSLLFSEGLWTLTYRGVVVVQSEIDGFFYIRELVAHPEVSIPVGELRQRIHRFKGASVTQASDQETDMQARSNDLGATLDDDALKQIRKAIYDLDQEIEHEKRYDNNPAAIEELREKRLQILKHLQKSTNRRGNSRSLSNPNNRDATNIRQRIKTAVKKIGRQNKNLGQHFDSCIRVGDMCVYTGTIFWIK